MIFDRYNTKGDYAMFELIPWRRTRDVDVFRSTVDSLFDRFFEDRPLQLFGQDGGWMPSVDVSETDGEFIVKAEIPGMEVKDIEVSLNKGTLTINGERNRDREENQGNYHCVERSYGSFRRMFHLPTEVDSEKVEAGYKDGVLKIRLPKSKEHTPSKIEVKAA
jgi:HSP20 family protein